MCFIVAQWTAFLSLTIRRWAELEARKLSFLSPCGISYRQSLKLIQNTMMSNIYKDNHNVSFVIPNNPDIHIGEKWFKHDPDKWIKPMQTSYGKTKQTPKIIKTPSMDILMRKNHQTFPTIRFERDRQNDFWADNTRKNRRKKLVGAVYISLDMYRLFQFLPG